MMNVKRKESRFLLITILGFLTAMGPLSIDMYLPAFEEIATDLNTDISNISLSLSSFFVGLSAGQLVYGPLLERFGRKKPIYIGLGVYILASIGCIISTELNELIIFRFLQALGGCAGLVSARAIVRDLFEVKDVARVFSKLIMVLAVSPIIAPTMGGYITKFLGWEYIFVVLILFTGLLLAASFMFLPESKQPDPSHSLRLKPILKNFWAILIHPEFFIYAFTGAIAYAGLYAYLSGSPHLYMDIFNISESQFGYVFAIIAGGLIGATQINNIVLKVLSSEQIILRALIAQCIIAVILALTTYLGYTQFYLTTILILAYLSSLGFIFPNASAMSLAKLGHTAGNASALMGSVQMTIGAIASAIVSLFQSDKPTPMTVTMLVCALMAITLFSVGRKRLSFQIN